MTATQITEAAKAIVSAREFCGNEREALKDWEANYGILTKEERIAARREADAIWHGYQVGAGVSNPISFEERAQINRIMERA